MRRVGSVVSVHDAAELVEGAGVAGLESHAPRSTHDPVQGGVKRPDGLGATVEALSKLFGARGEYVVDCAELVRVHGFESAVLCEALDVLRGASVVLLDPISGYDVWEGRVNAGRSAAAGQSDGNSREKLSRALCNFWRNSPEALAKSGSSSNSGSDRNDKDSGSQPQHLAATSVVSAIVAVQETMDVTPAQVEAVVEALCLAGVLRASSGRRFFWNEATAKPEQQEVDPLPAHPAPPGITRAAPSRVRVSAAPFASASCSPVRQSRPPKQEHGLLGRVGAGKEGADSPTRVPVAEQAQHNSEVLDLMKTYTAAVWRPPRAGSLALSQDCNSQETASGGADSGPLATADGESSTDQEDDDGKEEEEEEEEEGDKAEGSVKGPSRAAPSLAVQSGLLRSDTLESLRMVPIEIADSDVQQLLDFAGQRS